MYSEETQKKIRQLERFLYGGVVERHAGGLIYSADGSPVPISKEPIRLGQDPAIAKQVEQLFRLILSEGITFPEEVGYYTLPGFTTS